MSKERNITIDIIRIIAVLAVVMIHVSGVFVTNYSIGSIDFFTGNLFDSISRIGVPLFIMVSGSLMLAESRRITVHNIVFKNIKNMIFLIVLWSILYSSIYNVVVPLMSHADIDVKKFIKEILIGHYHMWYLYMIIGLYMATPFLKKFVSYKNKNMVLIYIFISIIVRFIPYSLSIFPIMKDVANQLIHFTDKFYLNFFSEYITYYLIGWYLIHIGIHRRIIRYSLYFLGLLSVLGIVVNVLITGNYNVAYSNYNLLVLVYSSGIFLLLNTTLSRKSFVNKKYITQLSKYTFGIYIVHPIIISIVDGIMIFDIPFLSIIVQYFSVILLSFLFTYVVSIFPYIKKIVRI